MNAALDLLQARAGEQLADLERVHRELSGVRVQQCVDDGRVRVTVGASGSIASLELDVGAASGDAARLADLIVEAAAAAAREVFAAHSAITADFLAEFGSGATAQDQGESNE